LLLAPAAALLSSLLAAFIGGVAGFVGGRMERWVMAGTDLFLSLPWLFLFINLRALLPLNVSPIFSVLFSFPLLGFFGLGGRGPHYLCRRPDAFTVRFHSPGAGFGKQRLPAFVAPPSTESEAGVVCAILDFCTCFYSDRSQSRNSRTRSRGAHAFMGQPA